VPHASTPLGHLQKPVWQHRVTISETYLPLFSLSWNSPSDTSPCLHTFLLPGCTTRSTNHTNHKFFALSPLLIIVSTLLFPHFSLRSRPPVSEGELFAVKLDVSPLLISVVRILLESISAAPLFPSSSYTVARGIAFDNCSAYFQLPPLCDLGRLSPLTRLVFFLPSIALVQCFTLRLYTDLLTVAFSPSPLSFSLCRGVSPPPISLFLPPRLLSSDVDAMRLGQNWALSFAFQNKAKALCPTKPRAFSSPSCHSAGGGFQTHGVFGVSVSQLSSPRSRSSHVKNPTLFFLFFPFPLPLDLWRPKVTPNQPLFLYEKPKQF